MNASPVFNADTYAWALRTICRLHRQPFAAQLALQQVAPPYGLAEIGQAARALGFRFAAEMTPVAKLQEHSLPCLVVLSPTTNAVPHGLAVLLRSPGDKLLLLEPQNAGPVAIGMEEFAGRYEGTAILMAR